VDQVSGTGLACNPLSALNALAVKNNIALVDRGACSSKTKVKNARDAGAKAVIVVDNVAGSPPVGLGDEPAINGDLTRSVVTPQDLTFKLLQDIGW